MRPNLPVLLLPLAVALGLGCNQPPLIPAPPDTGPELEAMQLNQGLLHPLRLVGQDREPMTLRERLDHYRVPGVSIAVIDAGELRWAKSWGVVRAGSEDPVTPDTLFQASSISKAVTSGMALSLVADGDLDLDADHVGLLEGRTGPTAGGVTLRRLLSHTAGIGPQGFAGYGPTEPVPDRGRILRGESPAVGPAVAGERPPGEAWQYSGGGYVLVEELLSRTLDMPFAELMERRLFEPLGMESSFFGTPSAEQESRLAIAHDADGEPLPGGFRVYPELAAAGLWSTPTDLAQWVMDVQKSYAGKPGRSLDRETARALLEPQEPGGWGLGVQLGGSGQAAWMGHSGGNRGFPSFALGFVSSGHGAVIMTNGEGGHGLIREIVAGLAEVYDWPTFRARAVARVTAEPEDLDALVGRYAFDSLPGRELVLERSSEDEGVLQAEFLGKTARLFPVEENRWAAPETSWEITAAASDSGETELRLDAFPGYRFFASRIPDAP